MKYSIFSLARNALTHHENWHAVWRSPPPQKSYQVVVVGGGGHGLATAYYLAKEHGINNVAVLEKGWIGGGNTGRNTTIVRSNYLWDESALLYEKSLQLWEGLSQDLNYNVMFSQRGVYNLGHSLQDMRDIARRVNANRLNGIDGELLDGAQVKARIPIINIDCRYPVLGASFQPRGGVARHDAVAWGFARAADARGVDIIQNCAVTGIRREGERVTGRGDRAWFHRRGESRRSHGRAQQRAGRYGRDTAAYRKPPAAGAGLGTNEARVGHRSDVKRGARLCESIRQGRTRCRFRNRCVHWLRATGQFLDHRG